MKSECFRSSPTRLIIGSKFGSVLSVKLESQIWISGFIVSIWMFEVILFKLLEDIFREAVNIPEGMNANLVLKRIPPVLEKFDLLNKKKNKLKE